MVSTDRVLVVEPSRDLAVLEAGATTLKAAKKSFWGYGAVVQAPDGAIWKIATSAKKATGPVTRQIDVVLLLGVDDVKATKAFYVDHGLVVAKSFGGKYVEFEATGSHRLEITSDAGPFVDPDGFGWSAPLG